MGCKFVLKFYILYGFNVKELVRCKELVPHFHKCKKSVPNPHTCEESVQNPDIREKWYQLISCANMVSKLTRVKIKYQILTQVKNWYQIITHMMIWYLIVADVSEKTVKNRNRMKKCGRWGGGRGLVLLQREEYACMLYKFDLVRIFHKV